MARRGSGLTSASKALCRATSRCIMAVVLALFLFPSGARCAPSRLVESNEYKDKDFHKGIITDYSNMVDGDDVQWVWIDPAVKLSQYKLKVGKVENKSDLRSRSMVETVKNVFKDAFSDMEAKGGGGTLNADLCIYEAENFSAGKAWIPFVGGHQMQAGIGIEMVLRDAKNRIVGKFRHSAREGAQIEAATQEVAGDLMKYIAGH
jgi:hypothetical protein